MIFPATGSWLAAVKIRDSAGKIAVDRQLITLPGGQAIVDLGGGVEMEFVWCPAGQFYMGSPDTEQCGQVEERPRHHVTLTKGFWIGKYEVTKQEWLEVFGSWPGSTPAGGDNHPAAYVSWDDIKTGGFLTGMNALGQGTFRLPTEAEWEYAARAGTQTRYSFGDASVCGCGGNEDCELKNYAWYDYNSSGSNEVGGKLPNPWGLHDIHGNVSEWCEDWWDGTANYPSTPVTDPKVLSGSNRVDRGGDWDHYAQYCRSAVRGGHSPGNRVPNVGLRLLREGP
jgi:formylglycine-generating enzyme required for sulfatase activity